MGGRNLLVFKGCTSKSEGVSYLLDTGANDVYCSASKAASLGTLSQGEEVLVEYGNGVIESTTTYCSMLCSIGTFQFHARALVVENSPYDVVLGMSWFHKHDPRVEWKDLTLSITSGK